MGLRTLIGPVPQGYFIPARNAAHDQDIGYPALEPRFRAAEDAFLALLDRSEAFAEDLRPLIDAEGPRARFWQDWFPRLDALVAYGLLRLENPGQVLEIGSGHSTRFLARAVCDGHLDTEITCVDPMPRAGISSLRLRHIGKALGEVDAADLPRLQAGDVLFIDSSHVAMPGSDVDRLLLDILPRLPAGVLVHVHDVFLPDAYPPEWRWRGYNEQLLVAALLIGEGFDIVFSSHWVRTRCPQRLDQGFLTELPLMPGAHETSLWLRKR